MHRPDWIQYFLGLAYIVSLRSPDPKKKHGAIIVDKNNNVLSLGYNGAPRNCPNHIFDWESSIQKAQFVVHSEENAILNAVVRLRDFDNLRLFCTGAPCIRCLRMLVQQNIRQLYYPPGISHSFKEVESENYDKILAYNAISIHEIERDLSWIK